MNSRPAPTLFFASQPSSQLPSYEQRQNTIPTPPFPVQVPPPSQTFFNNDVFLARKREQNQQNYEKQQLEIDRPGQANARESSYAASQAIDAMSKAMDEIEGLRTWERREDRKMDRYGSHGTEAPTASTALPPPPPSSTFRPSLHPQPTLDDPTCAKGHRSSSPRMYGAHSHSVSLPPPPPFANRHMLPPSSPSYNAPTHASRDPPPPSSFATGGRDLPALSMMNTRPGSSMSISSMLGADPTPPSRLPPASSYTNGSPTTTSYPPTGQHVSASSPTRLEHATTQRYRGSPEAQSAPQDSINRFRAYSGGAHSSNSSVKPLSPSGSRFNIFSGEAPQISPRSDTSAPHDWKRPHEKHSRIGRLIDRPSSQPSGHHASPAVLDRRLLESRQPQLDLAKVEEQVGREAARHKNRNQSTSFDVLGRPSQFARQDMPKQDTQPKIPQNHADDRLPASNYPFLSNSSMFSQPSDQDLRSEISSSRLGERDAQAESNVQKGPWGPEALRRLRDERLAATGAQQQSSLTSFANTRPRILDSLEGRQAPTDSRHSSTAPEVERASSIDRIVQQTRDGEVGNHRSSLALMLDHSKRVGRISPFPQAVQGAQGQTNGPSRDPSIKNEFSKMFAGIGSGVSSSGLAGSGASTPFPPSPKQNENDRLPFAGRNDLTEITKSRNGSRASNKRTRKMKDDDAKDDDSNRSTVDSSGNRGVKKTRHGHHRHAAGHHHHHHHRLDEQVGAPIRTASNPSPATPISHHHHRGHHHHHPDGTIHYHPSTKAAPAPQPKAVLRRPTTKIHNSPVLASVKHLPRNHLGTVLYSPTLNLTSAVYKGTKLPFASGQFAIPKYEGKENSCLTVRIPRLYLTKKEREHVCRCRAVWGVDIYTDDSDPLAAAVHAGWIRGAWGDELDLAMLDIKTSDEKVDEQDQFDSVPSSPVTPRHGKDLHLTLLLLPPLQDYASRIAHGIKSRTWGRDHDGLSFQIEKMAWVDERAGRVEERNGAAKKKRIGMLRSSSSGLGPAVKLGMGRTAVVAAAG